LLFLYLDYAAGSLRISHFDEQLAEIPSLQHANKGARGRLETFDDVLSITNSAVCYVGLGILTLSAAAAHEVWRRAVKNIRRPSMTPLVTTLSLSSR
jgi:hypothetical protein